jgi:hypothetical protein
MNAIDLKRLLGIKDNPVPQELLKAYPQLGGESAEGNVFCRAADGRRSANRFNAEGRVREIWPV